ncbi:MAG: imidazole glycerol phosphate synthase subunit HisF [Rickettsiales bacterium]|nr:imidazole glycerol phosphate synthase subunit HisF [Rickettsiales bacterium]
MLKVRIIPCLDVKNGRIVKGVNFIDLIDAGDPVEQAKIYSQCGADEITFLDITATSDQRETMLDVIEKTAKKCFVPLTVGGGIRSLEDMNNLLLVGADKISVNSSAVKNPQIVSQGAEKFGKQCIVVAIDAKKNNQKTWNVFTHGGRKDTGIDAVSWAKLMESKGAGEILLTSMDKDGTKSGFDLDLLKIITSEVSIPVVASGGVGTLRHLEEGVVIGSASALLAASIFHFGEFSITEVKKHLFSLGIPVRMDY